MRRIVVLMSMALCLFSAAAMAQDAKLQEAQKILQLLNLDPERPTGLPTPRSAKAIQEFQRTHSLPATGEIDDQTLEALRTVRDTSIGHSLMVPPTMTPEQRRQAAAPPAKPLAMPTESVDSQSLSGNQGVPDFKRGNADLPPAIANRFTTNSPLVTPQASDDDATRPPQAPPEEAHWETALPLWVVIAIGVWTLIIAWGVIARMIAPLGRRASFDDPEPATPLNRPEPRFDASR
jgi:hypothetical protein